MSMHKTTLAQGQFLNAVCMKESYHGKEGYPVLCNSSVQFSSVQFYFIFFVVHAKEK